MAAQTRVLDLFYVVGCALVLGASALVYQRVFIYHDSGTYYMYGEHIVSEIIATMKGTKAAIIPLGAEEYDYVGARSPSYSFFLYLATSRLTLWGVLACQALVTSWILLLVVKAARPIGYGPIFFAAVILITIGSSLSYFVSYAMPDVFGGIGALAIVGLLAFPDRLTNGARAGLLLCLMAAAAFHPTFPPMLLAALIAGSLTAVFVQPKARRGSLIAAGAAALAILIGAASGPAYREIERRGFDHPIEAPPFITARLLEDGTGVQHLKEACRNEQTYTLCRLGLDPPIDSDHFLWNRDHKGAYLIADPARRQAMREEELAFAIGTVFSRPLDQIAISLRNWGRQISLHEVSEQLWDPKTQTSYRLFDMTGSRPGVAKHFAWEAALDTTRTIVLWISLAGLLGCWLIAARPGTEASDRQRIYVTVVVVIVAVLVNAAICGAISKPYPRYAARISWLIPTAVLLLSLLPMIAINLGNSARRASQLLTDDRTTRWRNIK